MNLYLSPLAKPNPPRALLIGDKSQPAKGKLSLGLNWALPDGHVDEFVVMVSFDDGKTYMEVCQYGMWIRYSSVMKWRWVYDKYAKFNRPFSSITNHDVIGVKSGH